MEYMKQFEARFEKKQSFDGQAVKLTSQLQTTKNELNEANSEIESLRTLITESYKQAINSVMDIATLIDEANGKVPFKNIPFPKNRDSLSYGQMAGYSQFASAFYTFTTDKLIHHLIDAQDHLTSMSTSIVKTTIEKSSIVRSGGISLPELSEERETVILEKPIANAVKTNGQVAPPKSPSPKDNPKSKSK